MPRPIREFLGFMRFLARRFDEDRCIQIASSLTYTTLLSLVPLMVIAFTVISAFPVFSGLMTQLKIFLLTNMVPEVAGKIITVYMQQFSEKAARLTAAGIAALAVTALILMQTIEHAFNLIWRVTTRRHLLQRVLTYWAVLTLGPLLLGASLSLTSYLVSYSLGYVAFIPELGVVVLKVVPLVMTSLAFSLLYLAVPNRHVPLRHALTGGVVAGLGLGLMSKGFAAYILHFSGYTLVYGAFASLPVFLLWIYLSWLVVVSGAVVAASLPYWRGGMWRVERTAGRRYLDALCVLQALCRAQHQGDVLTLMQLQRETRVPLEELEDILLQLHDLHWVARTTGQRWLLAVHPGDVSLLKVFHRFMFKPDEDLPAESDASLAALSGRTAASLEQALAGSLEDLCAKPEQG
ncbi:MAG: YihY family inner membrane protein [Sulfuricella denitrificans]|nr:YihY family inner membrane protein [Sulfuricella denitrificans]